MNEWSDTDMRICKSESYNNSNMNINRHFRKTKKYMNSQGRIVNSKAYAIAWGIINKPYSSKDLYIKCKDPEAPSYYYIVKTGWKGYPRYYNDLVKAGMEPRPPRTDKQRRKMIGKISRKGFKIGLLEKDYDLVRLVAQCGILKRDEYRKYRYEHPQLSVFLPTSTTIEKRYGNWKRFAYQVMKYNTDLVITEYVEKSAQCGHWLKLSECDKLKIPIRGIMDMLRPTIFNALCYKKLSLMNKKI